MNRKTAHSGRMAAARAALRRDTRGVAAVEFALVAPVLLMTLFGLFDLGYNLYTAELLEGAVQKAARDATIEGSQLKTDSLDQSVTDMVHRLAPAAELTFTRTAYSSFSDVGKPEDYDDLNGNSKCDAGEPYEDANNNGHWDADRGKQGMGGARDAVLYQVEITYPRPFPVTALLGMGSDFTLNATTVLRNQPYDLSETTPHIGNCP